MLKASIGERIAGTQAGFGVKIARQKRQKAHVFEDTKKRAVLDSSKIIREINTWYRKEIAKLSKK